MAKHLIKNAVHAVMLMAFALSFAGCSKTSADKSKSSKPKSEFSDRRKPKDNMFIQGGGYSKKSKVNPFTTSDPHPASKAPQAAQSSGGEKVVYEKPVAAVGNVAMVSPVADNKSEAPTPKRSFFKALFTKIASIFKSDTPAMTQVASSSTLYRPMVNKMVMDGVYTPKHDGLIEQGSFDDEYLLNTAEYDSEIVPIEPTDPIEGRAMLIVPAVKSITRTQSFAEQKKPAVMKAVTTSAKKMPLNTPVPNLKPAVVVPLVASTDVFVESREESLEKQLSSTLVGLVNVSKALYGISVDKEEVVDPFPAVNVPEITKDDLKNRSGEKQKLSDIPPVPKEFSSQES